MWKPNESAMLSATAIINNEPITLALALPEDNKPKTIPRLVTVDEVAPKLNLPGSFGSLKNFFQKKTLDSVNY